MAPLLLQLYFLKGSDRNLIDYTSSLVVTVVGEARHVILKSGYVWSSEMQRQLQTPLDSSANVKFALRYAIIALNYLDGKVLHYLAPKTAPLDLLATVESTSTGDLRDSYDQLAFLHKLLLIFSRFPLEMQKEGGLGAVQRELRRGRASPQPTASTTSPRLGGTTPSDEIVAPKPSSSTVAVLRSDPDVTMDTSPPPPPSVPTTSSSLGGTLPSTESAAPSSSLTNNVNPTSDTAASSKAPLPSDCALASLLTKVASRKKKDISLDATAMVVDSSGSALVSETDPLVLKKLLDDCSLTLPANSKALTKADVKKGEVLYTVQNGTMALCRVTRVHKGWAYVQDSATEGSLQVRPGTLRVACLNDVARFPPVGGPLTEEPLLATLPPAISLPPDDTIITIVDGTRQILSERDIRINKFTDADRRRLQIPVETLSDALGVFPPIIFTLDGLLKSIIEGRARTIDERSLKKFNSEVHSLVLLGSARKLLQEWTKVPDHKKPPLISAPVARPTNESIVDGSRERKTIKRLTDDRKMQASSCDQDFWRNVRDTQSCAVCAGAFSDGAQKIWRCMQDGCGYLVHAKCAGYAETSAQRSDSKWMCPPCKSSEPIDVVKPTQAGGSLVHNEARLLVTERIKLAFGEDYEPYCKYMGPKFGSKDWYDLEVFTGAYEGEGACRRFTKSPIGTGSILIDWKGNGVFAVFDEFWDSCRKPGETPLQVAKRMAVEVHPGFEVIAGLFEWGVLHYLDGEKGGFVGGWRMERLRDDHHVDQRSMPTAADFLAAPYQECLKRTDEPDWPTPELKDMYCEYGAEEARRLAISGPDVPPARGTNLGPGSRNHAPETPAVIVADREERGVRERANLEFLSAFKANQLHDPALQVIDGLRRVSGWLPIACADCGLGPDQHIKQQTPLYLAAVRVRELMGEYETRGAFVKSPLRWFLNTGVGDGSDLDKLRNHWNVFMGASWRVRYRETPISEYKYVELPSVWEPLDPAARNAGPEALPAPELWAPHSKKRKP